MRWYLNDLSLGGQFVTSADFEAAVTALLTLRIQSPTVRDSLFASRAIGQRPVVGITTFAKAVYDTKGRAFRQAVLQWITSQGPFIDDERQLVDDDLFYFQDHDVTEQGLGEASRRITCGQNAGSFSFSGGPIDVTADPLVVTHGLLEAPFQTVQVPNVCDAELLRLRILSSLPPPRSWQELLDQCRIKFGHLTFSDGILPILAAEPFSSYVCERSFALLGVLEEYICSLLPDGSRSPRSHEIVQIHFTGDKAWFSDESEGNKNAYRNEMTFEDPLGVSDPIFAPWHGKIKSPQYRIHFDWPVRPPVNQIRVFYIGPKITKR